MMKRDPRPWTAAPRAPVAPTIAGAARARRDRLDRALRASLAAAAEHTALVSLAGMVTGIILCALLDVIFGTRGLPGIFGL